MPTTAKYPLVKELKKSTPYLTVDTYAQHGKVYNGVWVGKLDDGSD